MKPASITLNENVYVYLTPLGRSIYELYDRWTSAKPVLTEDGDGASIWKLHDLFSIFGNFINDEKAVFKDGKIHYMADELESKMSRTDIVKCQIQIHLARASWWQQAAMLGYGKRTVVEAQLMEDGTYGKVSRQLTDEEIKTDAMQTAARLIDLAQSILENTQ